MATDTNRRFAIKRALEELFAASGAVDVDDVIRAFTAQDLVISENAVALPPKLRDMVETLRRGIVDSDNVMTMREKWTDEPMPAVPVETINNAIDDWLTDEVPLS